MSKLKILYVTHEMTPYMEMTHMSDNARFLPQKMQDKDMEVRVFMPRFGIIKERKHRLHEVIRLSGINVPVGDDDNPLLIKVASLPAAKMQIYFLDNDDYFSKRGYYGDDTHPFYTDNDERVIFFNKGVMEIIHKLEWVPDIIHCQGWMSGLVPMYARTVPRNENLFKHSRFIYTPYEDLFTDTLGTKLIEKAVVSGQDPKAFIGMENPSITDFYNIGVHYADGITMGSSTVNPTIVAAAEASGKPLLHYHENESENFIEKHIEFYHSLLELKHA